jgi:hypothetical protein
VGSPDRDRVVPGAALTRGSNLTVKDHDAWLPAFDGCPDQCVIGDRDRVVPGLV